MKNYPDHLTTEYEMLECLASHDYSETILAIRRSDEKLCVIKVFFSESPLYYFVVPDKIKRLDHPFIPHLLDEYKSENLRYEIREYVPGVSLDKLMQNRVLSKTEKDRISLQLCDILQYLHTGAVPVIHRDIKPQNIIITDSGNLYLIDFGIARTKHSVPEPSDTVICTTRDFSAPEQYGFMETDNRSDIYSFGQVLRWLYNDDSDEIDSVINRCTAFDPADRYQSIEEVHRALISRHNRKSILIPLIIMLLTILCFTGTSLFIRNRHNLKEPLIEEAARKSLGVTTLHHLSNYDLQKVETLYIVADKSYASSDEFYAAVSDWYANGRQPSGNISTLEDCSRMKNLKELCIAGEQIRDLSPLSACKKLEKIEVKHNNISDITVLGDIPTLISVGINSNPVTDISPLEKLKNLRYLDLCNVMISDPSVLERLGDFEYLDIDNGTQAYKYLSGKNITYLRLGNIFSRDLSFLKEIKGLKTVQLYFENRERIDKLGDIDFEVIYEGVDIPVKDIPYNKINKNEETEK